MPRIFLSLQYLLYEILVLIIYTQKPPLHNDVPSRARGLNFGLSLHLHPSFVYGCTE